MDNDDNPKTDLSYEEACHAMQTGVAHTQANGSDDGSPKHLRAGINSCQVNDAAVARLLIKKGIFTIEEYSEEVRLEMCREVDRYEQHIDPSGRVKLR